MREEDINKLLYDIPDNVDYACIPADLDYEDIPIERVKGLEKLLKEDVRTFEVSMLLTSWGYDSGFERLTTMFNQGELKGYINDRIHNYDETYKHVLESLIRYWINQKELGNHKIANDKVLPYIMNIIKDSKNEMYDLDPLVIFLRLSDNCEECVKLIERNLKELTPNSENFYWRVRSDLELIKPYDTEFVENFVEKYDINMEEN